MIKQIILSGLLLWSCDTGKLEVIADMPSNLTEISAVEMTSNSDLFWVIEDAGNDNHLYGLDSNGIIKKDLTVLNSENNDWEDLTSDENGAIYIGDFGNNSEKRKNFTIYKISSPEKSDGEVRADIITFNLPKDQKSKDFEGFFLYEGSFYIFSKEPKKCILIKVPNTIGAHTAEVMKTFKLEGKNNEITSADISDDGKTIILLNHDKVWKLSDYDSDDFFGGRVESLPFNYSTQMEGVCISNNLRVFLTNEDNGGMGSNLYKFKN